MTAPAKLNLMLHIVGHRTDGYHELQTLFQLLDWGDRLTFTPQAAATGPVTLDDNSGLPFEDNLIRKAANTLLGNSAPPFPVHITLDKQIPVGGGLGGGSSDAAATLLVLNSLWCLGYSIDAVAAMGEALGADVPVFVRGHSAWAEGIGERLTTLTLPDQWFLVADPGVSVSTGGVFAAPGLTRNSQKTTMRLASEGGGRNDCEPVVRQLYPAIDDMLNVLDAHGRSRLTGTGGCAFLAFPELQQARSAAASVGQRYPCYIARACNRSPVIDVLASLDSPTPPS